MTTMPPMIIGRQPSRLLLCLFVVGPLVAEDPKLDGIDVVQATKAVRQAIVGPPAKAGRGTAWEADIAGITDSRSSVHNQAMSNLIRRGEVVTGDLQVLAGDPDWQIRTRVVTVLAAIGGDQATAVLIPLCRDRDQRVRELATLGLGQARGAGSFETLGELMRSGDSDIRQASARSLGAHGDPRGLVLVAGYARERDDLARREMREALTRLVVQERAVSVLAELIASRTGDERQALIEASFVVGDPRLAPALITVVSGTDRRAATIAAQSLAANGDSRAVAGLCRAAASDDVALREAAAASLRTLTGHQAASGPAWELWWRDHAAEVEHLVPRDALIAELHDPRRAVTRDELAVFPVTDLRQLVTGVLGVGAPWWPARAGAVLMLDEPSRWTVLFLAEIRASTDVRRRLSLIVLLDQLGDPKAGEGLAALVHDAEAKVAGAPQLTGAERIAIRIARERRGQRR